MRFVSEIGFPKKFYNLHGLRADTNYIFHTMVTSMVTYMYSQLIAVLETVRHDFHFPGHLIPGTAFIGMGIWWIWNTFQLYFENEKSGYCEHFVNTENKCENFETDYCVRVRATYNGDIHSLLYSEGFYKTVYASFDLFCHILVVVYGGDVTDEEQHMTVYIFFILNGIIDMNLHIKLYKMPNGSDYIAASITWTALGFLFLSHKHAKTVTSIYYHMTLGWIAIAVAFVTLIQYKYDKNTLIALARGSCCIFAGTWLYQIAFSFHNPFVGANQFQNIRGGNMNASYLLISKEMHHNNFDTQNIMNGQMEIMHTATITTWHIILVCTTVVALGIIASTKQHRYYKRIRSFYV